MSETKNLPAQIQTATSRPPSVFSGAQAFEDAQRMAKALCASSLVPTDYQGNGGIPNAMIALEMAQRVGASPLAVMQNMHVIHGRPSWSSSFIIASLNSCGRFSPIRFVVSGEGDAKSCFAWAYDSTGEKLEGPAASIGMAKAEGWYGKNGSKWKTMPDLMLRYRAAAFFGRLYAPDILMGMHADDEVQDMGAREVTRGEAPELVTDVDPVITAHAEVVTEQAKTVTTESGNVTEAVEAEQQDIASEEPDREELKRQLDELGIDYSAKTRTNTLQQMLEDAQANAEESAAPDLVDDVPPHAEEPPPVEEPPAEQKKPGKVDLF